jgi:KaiC/GvpD/RAD55 family RecA-like ATPase
LYEPFSQNPDFVGRSEVIDEIKTELLPRSGANITGKVFILSGLGGIGKTQTALQYMFDTLDEYDAVLWVTADSRSKIVERLLQFGIRLGLVGSTVDDPQDATQRVRAWFAHAGESGVL